MPVINDAIRVGIQAGRGIIVYARGNPAWIVAFGSAAAIAAIGTATAYYVGVRSRQFINGVKRNNRLRNSIIRRRWK